MRYNSQIDSVPPVPPARLTSSSPDATGEPWSVRVEDIRGLVAKLNYFCFRAAEVRFAEERELPFMPSDFFESAPRDDVLTFLQYVNWSLKQAQDLIVEWRLRLESAAANEQLNLESPYRPQYLQRLLVDYADSLGWMLLCGDISWVRSMILEVKSPGPLRSQNWGSVERVLADLNSDLDQFALATDLTSFMHVGDIFLRNVRTGRCLPIEVKTGAENERVLEVLSGASEQEFGERLNRYLMGAKNPHHALRQVERNLKQRIRMADAAKYHVSQKRQRVQLKTGEQVIVHESENDEDSWSALVRDASRGLESGDAVTGVVDDCLFFEYGRARHTNERHVVFQFRVSKHLGLSTSPELVRKLRVFGVGQHTGMPGFVPQSTSLLALGEERQARLLALDDYLLVHLNIPALKQFLEGIGLLLRVRNAPQRYQSAVDPLTRDVLGNNKIASITFANSKAEMEVVLSSGLIGRILFNFLRPRTILDMVSTQLSSAEKWRSSPATSERSSRSQH